MTKKTSPTKVRIRGTIIAIALLLVAILGIRAFYYNVVVPWPYRADLQSCLSAARSIDNEQAMQLAEDACFDAYPHAN